MKSRQVPVHKGKSSGAVARAAEGLSAVFALAMLALGLLPDDLSAAIDPSEHVRAQVSSNGVTMAQASPPAPAAGGGGVVVPPIKREQPTAVPAQPATEAPPPAPAAPAEPVAKPAQPAPQTAAKDKKAPPPPEFSGVFGAIQEWLARANRDYQGVVIKELSLPPAGKTAEDAIAKKLEETKAEDARQAADAKKREEAKREEDKQRAAQKAAEAKRLAEEESRKKAAAQAKPPAAPKPEVAAPKATPEPKADPKAAEAARIAEELRRTEQAQQEEARRREAQKLEAQKQEAQRQDAEKKAEETRRLEDEQRKAEARIAEERRKTDEAERAKPRQRSVVITVEPIPRPAAVGTTYRPEFAGRRSRERVQIAEGSSESGDGEVLVARRTLRLYRAGSAHRGTAVKRWVYRADNRRCRRAGVRITPPARYAVARGDSLWRISDRHYNEGKFYPRIFSANRDRISDPDLIYPCQRLLVPRKR